MEEVKLEGYSVEEVSEEEAWASEALLRAVLELIDKCDTMEELRESVKRIVVG